jgi:hypothetical protein
MRADGALKASALNALETLRKGERSEKRTVYAKGGTATFSRQISPILRKFFSLSRGVGAKKPRVVERIDARLRAKGEPPLKLAA